MSSNNNILLTLKDYFFVTLGILAYSLGWSVFLVPNNMIGGGVTGIASIIQYATGIKIGYTYFALNSILIILALKILGRSFGGKTVYAIILASVCLTFFQEWIPGDIIHELAIKNGKLMCTIMGAIMVGVGMGFTISHGGSTGGTDIIALIVNKYRNVSPGRMILWMDIVIILSSLLVPSFVTNELGEQSLMPWPEKITIVVFGLIYIVIISTTLDLFLSGSKRSVQVFVFSKKHKEIADAITNELHHGVTVLNGQGWYSQEEIKVVTIVTRKTDLNVVLRCINSIDRDAFVSVSFVTGVYGKGFDRIKK